MTPKLRILSVECGLYRSRTVIESESAIGNRKSEMTPWVLTIIANSFYRTTGESFLAGGFFFGGFRLLEHEGITVFVRPTKAVGRSVATNIAIDA